MLDVSVYFNVNNNPVHTVCMQSQSSLTCVKYNSQNLNVKYAFSL